MDSKISRFCDGLIEAGWLAAIIITPLFFNLHASRFFEPGKVTLLRSIALLMAAAWLIKFIDRQSWPSFTRLGWRGEHSIWRMPFIIPMTMLALIYLVSTAFSITRTVSWAGSYQRWQGTYTTLAYIVIFALMISTLRTSRQVTRLVSTIIATSIPISLYGMMQRLGLDPIAWIGFDVQARPSATLGNSIFFAAYLIMVVPLTPARLIEALTNTQGDEQITAAGIVRTLLYIFTLVIQVIAILWSGNRGPFLALVISLYVFILILLITLRNTKSSAPRLSAISIVHALTPVLFGVILPFLLITTILSTILTPQLTFILFLATLAIVVVVILLYALFQKGWQWLWLTWIILAIVLASFFGLFNTSSEISETVERMPVVGNVSETLAAWRELPEIGRFGRLLEAETEEGRVRVLIWEGVLDLISPHEPLETPNGTQDPFNIIRPIIGYGPESMFVTFNRYYRPELATLEGHLASPDRSHNETFDALVLTGITGLTVWQLLYLSVFYYGFRWLGIVRAKRDRNVLIGSWIGGGLLGGLMITSVLGKPFLGVAVPFGTIVGIVIYLIYYAVTTGGTDEGDDKSPFGMNRLLMIGLVSAVLAHYIEIQFGIAITATRTYFFAYLALMFCIGYRLPKVSSSGEAKGPINLRDSKGQQSRADSSESGGWAASVLSRALILALIIGILVYNFVIFQLPEGQTIATIDGFPSVGGIIKQAFFVNVKDNFTASPFLYMMLIISWLLGSLIFLIDLGKSGRISYVGISGKHLPRRSRPAALIFFGMLLIMAVGRILILRPEAPGVTQLVGSSLLLIWAVLSLWAGIGLFLKQPSARRESGIVATIGTVFAVPLLFAGAIPYSLVLLVGCGVILYLIWDPAWKNSLLPFMILALFSLGLGLLYATYHAFRVHAEILPSPAITESTPAVQQRLLEVNQTISLITAFYIFSLVVLSTIGLTIAWSRMKGLGNWGSTFGLIAAALLIPVSIYFIWTTNVHVMQADMAFRKAELWSRQAKVTGESRLWDNATTAFQRAIELAPAVETYHQLLGGAYLERSFVTATPDEQEKLLKSAESQLLQARDINPLNTDNTANLARISTYWAEMSTGDDRERLISQASDYYESAISLSPQNSIIINEYAQLVYELQNDCQKSLSLLDHSVEVDPFYSNTYIDRAETYLACGDQYQGEEKQSFYDLAVASANQGLESVSDDAQIWLQFAKFYIKLGQYDKFAFAYDKASSFANDNLLQWQIDLAVARSFSEQNEYEMVKQFGRMALNRAPQIASESIQELLDSLEANGAD